MLLKKGIVRKTFFFSSMLILLVILVSFAILYYMMPRFYLRWKEDALRGNLTSFAQKLKLTEDYDAGTALIQTFCEDNNVMLIAFDSGQNLIAEMSSPFIGMRGGANSLYIGRAAGEEVAFGVQEIDAAPRLQHSAGTVSLRWAMPAENPLNYISMEEKIGTVLVDTIIVRGALQPIDEASGVILSLLPYVLGAAIILGMFLSGIYANMVSRPLLAISDAALKMQTMESGISSGIRTDDELGRLSSNLDALYGNLLDNMRMLRSEMDEVNRLERSKTEMMQSASHELKTPVTALGGMLEGMIDNIGQYKDRDRYLQECKEQVDRLASLVGEILDASAQDLSDKQPIVQLFDAESAIDRSLDENRYEIASKRLFVSKDTEQLMIKSNPQLFYRIVSNIMSNAVRYTPDDGNITIRLAPEAPAQGRGAAGWEQEHDAAGAAASAGLDAEANSAEPDAEANSAGLDADANSAGPDAEANSAGPDAEAAGATGTAAADADMPAQDGAATNTSGTKSTGAASTDRDGAAWVLSIGNDCGEPISDMDLQKILEPFYTRSYSRNRDTSGTGLGLYIVRRGLERLKIAYRLDNSNSRFEFSLILPQFTDL